jgi:alpha-tubulin suppressor-like RCC1 family protein
MFCWGLNTEGQTGQTPGDPTVTPQKIGHESIFYQASCGASHTCALDAQKALYCWGSNDVGQLGVATSATQQTHLPQQVIADSVTAFQKVAVGHDHACAIDEENALWCWGKNEHGQCGANPEDNNWVSPFRVGTLNSWQHVAAGKQITCAIRQGGSLFCWGAVIFDSALPDMIESTANPVLIDSALSYTTVTVGEGFIMGLDENGQRYGRGQNRYGQLGNEQAWTFAPEMITTDTP